MLNTAVISPELTPEQAVKFEKYYELLAEWNKVMNLTAIIDPDEVALRHFADSLSVLPYIDRMIDARKNPENSGKTGNDPEKPEKIGISLIDVGTGAGFPGIPLKIMRPELDITLLDSLKKRLNFLDTVIKELGLKEIRTVHARAEDAGRSGQYRERFDVAVARAVAPMNILVEYCLPLVKNGGQFIAMKGPAEEDASRAIKELNGRLVSDDSFELGTEETLKRRIICVAKIAPAPSRYPRKAGLPAKAPL